MGTKVSKSVRPQHLPQYVGFAQVQDALSVSRRTVERMVRDGKFPKPIQLSPNRVGWRVEAITQWLAERERSLTAKAVALPEDLSPDEFEMTMKSLAAGYLSSQLGHGVSASEISVSIAPRSAPVGQAVDPKSAAIDEFDGRFDHFEVARALVVTAWLFPSLRPWIGQCVDGDAKRVVSDPEVLRDFGSLAMVDQDWEENQAEVERRRQSSL